MTNAIIKPEQSVNLFGIPARAFGVVADTETGRILKQRIIAPREYAEAGRKYRITVNLRFDDSCGNGQESFAITGDIDEWTGRTWREHSGGCVHDEIARHFPELAHLIKWHLFDTRSPRHYIANTAYLAGDRDFSGMLAGEERQIKNGRTGVPCWRFVLVDETGAEVKTRPQYLDSEIRPETNLKGEWRPWLRVGEGKARDLDGARVTACWPEATDEELSAPRADLEAALLTRLPALLAAFKADIEAAGLLWPAAAMAEA
ncbi:MAG: hypothetical protein WAZ18_04070 [Alphaproteobacteria bacterium]